MARSCYHLTDDELTAQLASGKVLVSGPYDGVGDCEAACNEFVILDCCPGVELPATLCLTLANVVGCPCLEGFQLEMPFSSFHGGWYAQVSDICGLPGITLTANVVCNGGPGCTSFGLSLFAITLGYATSIAWGDSGSPGQVLVSTCSCEPLSLTWTGLSFQDNYSYFGPVSGYTGFNICTPMAHSVVTMDAHVGPGPCSGTGTGTGTGTGSGGGPVVTACCPSGLSETLCVTFDAPGCVTLDGVAVTLTWNSSYWAYSGTVNGGTLSLVFSCTGDTPAWQMLFDWNNSADCHMEVVLDQTASVCSPLSVTLSGDTIHTGAGCCNGGVDFTLTATVTEGACGVMVSCCVDSVPSILHLNITNPGGGCDCVAGSYALVFDGGHQWVITPTPEPCGGGWTLGVILGCSGGLWSLTLSCGTETIFLGTAPSTANCAPFLLDFGTTSIGGVCCSGGTIGVTVTE